MTPVGEWRPTAAHGRATWGGISLCVVAVLAHRPDLAVLATPLVGAAVWAAVRRPTQPPTISQSIGHATLREGQATTWHIRVDDPEGRAEDVAALLGSTPWVDRLPEHGQVAADLRTDRDGTLAVQLHSMRWGRRRVEPATVVASSCWGAFQVVANTNADAQVLLTLPQPTPFDASAPPVRTPGLIGVNRSPRQGGGTEYAGTRPFQPGDRLRRIHWPRTIRTGELHVTATWADHDRQVILLIDALDDVGASTGLGGRASSLDIAVRAASAIAEHHIAVGDRVGLVALGARGVQRVPAAAGFRHLRRLLETMSTLERARGPMDDGRLPRGLSESALVVMLSPLLSPAALRRAHLTAERAVATVVIDCLPEDIARQDTDDPFVGLTWRIQRLARERELRRIREAGIAVVPWRGPGSLDAVLRDLHQRSRTAVRGRR
ncbi:MAG TPA: DUF58 domain-containing protein [Ilumatobacteraceae bacterium]|nr:DUF58 domain-containing protein [Ilumatobacteraceae bacterium]